MERIVVQDLAKIYGQKKKDRSPGARTALQQIDFAIKTGESVGIVGRNGSGKSTLLKLICGVTAPTRGKVWTKGRVAALLELGAGFHPEYTGIENLYLNGAIHGLQPGEIKEKIPEIIAFSEIGEMAENPVKTYSDGMFVRLAFSAAICTRPDILVIDEALAVGDIRFQAKCFRKLEELKKQGVTLLYVSHDVDAIRRVCDRALWLENGVLQMDGAVAEVTAAYIAFAKRNETEEVDGSCVGLRRFGSEVGAITKVTCPALWKWNETIAVQVQFQKRQGIQAEGLTVSLAVKNQEGLDLLVLDQSVKAEAEKEQDITVIFRFQSPLCNGRYLLAVGLEQRCDGAITYYDYWEGVEIVRGEGASFGVFRIPAEVEVYETKREYPSGQ